MIPPLNYLRPSNLEIALSFLSDEKLKPRFILAGGTDLIVELRKGNIPPDSFVVDISLLPELRRLDLNNGELQIGPLITHKEISDSSLVRTFSPLLSRACGEVGTPQVRARGTIGGNIAHASPAADSIPPLLLHDAVVHLRSLDSTRSIPLSSFLKGPYSTDLKEGELIERITLSPLKGFYFGFERLIPRQRVGIPRLIICVALKVGQVIEEARISIGAATPVAFRARWAEDFLKGKFFSDGIFHEASRLASQEMLEISGMRWSTPYKKPVLEALLRRALKVASGSAPDE